MNNLKCLFQSLTINSDHTTLILTRNVWNTTHRDIPKFRKGALRNANNLRRKVFYPKDHNGDEAYTVKPLKYMHLAGRDPISGRIVAKHLGGGIKETIQWVHFYRTGPTDDSPPKEEKVLQIIKSVSKSVRTADLALVGDGDFLKCILATENMKVGDILKTSQYLPRIPVRAKEGDAHPIGALTIGTVCCCVEKVPGKGAYYARAAGNCVTIVRHLHERVVIQLPSKHEVAVDKMCMATVGRISNIEHIDEHVGSPNRQRELGNRPKSGLWQRKTGYDGKKIRPLPALKIIESKVRPFDTFQLTLPQLGMKTKAINKKSGLGWHDEPLYMEKVRKLKELEDTMYKEE